VGLLAAIRPDDENVPLLLHVLGGMLLVGGLLTAASALVFARGNAFLLRIGYYSLAAAALPGWVSMFVGAEWIYRTQGLAGESIDSTWVLVGFLAAEVGGLLLVVSLILGGIGVRRLDAGKGATLLKATMILSLVLVAANLIAVWAMAGKPN
jgi:hypothetical protein